MLNNCCNKYYPGPITFLIRSVPLYVLMTLNIDVFELINLLLATHKKDTLGVCLTFMRLPGKGADFKQQYQGGAFA